MATTAKQKNGETNINKEEQKPWDPLIDGVRWIERYSDSLEKIFDRIPDVLGTIIASLAIFTLGSTLRGEWVVILVSALKHASGHTQAKSNLTTQEIFSLFTEANLKMENFSFIFIMAHVVSFSMYFLSGGFLHWYFYVKRRDRAEEWKIQPKKWITPELERDEIYMGTIALLWTGSLSAFLACYIINGNPSTIYFQFDEYGWWWFFLQWPVVYIYLDYATYLIHRLYHTPFLYKRFHKLHHKYKTPTAFSVTAIHPFEIVHIQLILCVPLFFFPTHWVPYFTITMYNYFHGILDHSGINFKAQWWQPWQPDAEFHDKHHEFFHCNFGFNMTFWDRLHGTMRKENKLYTEETFNANEAPLIDSEEAKAMAERDPDAKENLISTKNLLNAAKEQNKKVK
ncbi:hypothetical protein O0L34_g4640 [Tuta absoluta]|nr:hypothetical protein O0L34_g4640 [Tuta absoluta]